MSKRAIEIVIDEKNPQLPVSLDKEARQAHVDAYAKNNPAKYEIKKDALKAWVNGL